MDGYKFIGLLIVILLGLPIMAYLIMKFGTAGYLRAKQLFTKQPPDNNTK